MIRLERFGPQDYVNLISWIDTEEMLIQIAGRQMEFPVTEDSWTFLKVIKKGLHSTLLTWKQVNQSATVNCT